MSKQIWLARYGDTSSELVRTSLGEEKDCAVPTWLSQATTSAARVSKAKDFEALCQEQNTRVNTGEPQYVSNLVGHIRRKCHHYNLKMDY